MMGEELNAAEVTERGVLGDRAHALIDVETETVQHPGTSGIVDVKTHREQGIHRAAACVPPSVNLFTFPRS